MEITTEISSKIEMEWSSTADNSIRISLDNPVDEADGETVAAVMEQVIAQNVLQDSAGNAADVSVGARVVETTVKTQTLF